MQSQRLQQSHALPPLPAAQALTQPPGRDPIANRNSCAGAASNYEGNCTAAGAPTPAAPAAVAAGAAAVPAAARAAVGFPAAARAEIILKPFCSFPCGEPSSSRCCQNCRFTRAPGPPRAIEGRTSIAKCNATRTRICCWWCCCCRCRPCLYGQCFRYCCRRCPCGFDRFQRALLAEAEQQRSCGRRFQSQQQGQHRLVKGLPRRRICCCWQLDG